MNKHVLMLTAATVALMAGPAFATTTITTKQTSPLKTSTANSGAADDIVIDTGGSVVITDSVPAITIDSANSVKINPTTTISNLNTDSAIGIQLDAIAGGGNGTASGTPALDVFGTIDLTGSGTGKTGILVDATNPGDVFNGDIMLESGSSLKVKGDNSTGLQVATDATLNGNITILGNLLVSATNATSTSSSGITAMRLDGTVNGDVTIGEGIGVQAVGAGANGLIVTGHVTGSLSNSGNLEVAGTTTPKSTGGNPEAGSALLVSNNIDGGIYNGGPTSSGSSTARASLGIGGVGPAVQISPDAGGASGSAMTIGVFGDLTDPGFSFLNRGAITATALDPNFIETGLYLKGTVGAPLTLNGGIFNGGTITANSTSDGTTPYSASAIVIDGYVKLNDLGGAPYAIQNSIESGSGSITASVSGTGGGVATAISIGANSQVASLSNEGVISAKATTSDTSISNLGAYAIRDSSGSLLSIDNSGSIIASATVLDDASQVQTAVDLRVASGNVMFNNTGVVDGDVYFGAYNDTLDVNNSTGNTAMVTGDIAFGGTNGGGYDTLNIGTAGKGEVTGAVTESGGGRVNVTIGGNGTLTLQNTAKTLQANDVTVQDGGILNISLSNGFNQAGGATNPALITTRTATLGAAVDAECLLRQLHFDAGRRFRAVHADRCQHRHHAGRSRRDLHQHPFDRSLSLQGHGLRLQSDRQLHQRCRLQFDDHQFAADPDPGAENRPAESRAHRQCRQHLRLRQRSAGDRRCARRRACDLCHRSRRAPRRPIRPSCRTCRDRRARSSSRSPIRPPARSAPASGPCACMPPSPAARRCGARNSSSA